LRAVDVWLSFAEEIEVGAVEDEDFHCCTVGGASCPEKLFGAGRPSYQIIKNSRWRLLLLISR
jgi:hypothetical protein